MVGALATGPSAVVRGISRAEAMSSAEMAVGTVLERKRGDRWFPRLCWLRRWPRCCKRSFHMQAQRGSEKTGITVAGEIDRQTVIWNRVGDGELGRQTV